MERRGFFWRLFEALNPLSYDRLAALPLRDAFFYVPEVLLVSFLVMMAISVPFLVGIPGEIDRIVGKAENLNFKITFDNTEPIQIPSTNPLIIIDRHANVSAKIPSHVLLTNDSVVVKPLLCHIVPATCAIYDFGNKRVEKNLAGYSDALAHKDFYTSLFAAIFFLMLPTIILLSYLMYLAKYFLIAGAFTLIAFAIARMFRYEVTLVETLKISLYSLTAMILLEILLIPFSVRLFYLHHALFVIYGVLGILRVGYHDRTPRRRMNRGMKRDYVDLHEHGYR